jgi:hypothetical protein
MARKEGVEASKVALFDLVQQRLGKGDKVEIASLVSKARKGVIGLKAYSVLVVGVHKDTLPPSSRRASHLPGKQSS